MLGRLRRSDWRLVDEAVQNTPEELSAVSGTSDEEEDAYADGFDEDVMDFGDAASHGEAMDYGEDDMEVDEARGFIMKGPHGRISSMT